MATPDPDPHAQALLDRWERGIGRDRFARDDALLGEDAPRGLGARNIALLELRNRLFGRRWPLTSDCPDCGETSAFEIDGAALAADLAGQPAAARAGTGPRAPTVDDLIAAAAEPTEAERIILTRCLGHAPAVLEGKALTELERAIEALDPAAAVSFALDCPACGHRWSAPVDIGAATWAEVRRGAETLLIEVDALARAYGWREADVLALPPTRRAAYLQLVDAA